MIVPWVFSLQGSSELHERTEKKRAIVIGGGVTGLSAAHELSKHGWQVDLFEARCYFGGAAASSSIAGLDIDRFYHFFCRGDEHLFSLLQELELGDELHWHRCRMAALLFEGLFEFGSGVGDLFGLHVLSAKDRLQLALALAKLHFSSPQAWHELRGRSAWDWVEQVSAGAARKIYHPLLRAKFGRRAEEIAAPWLWARMKRVAQSQGASLGGQCLAFLEHGSKSLVEKLVKSLKRRDCRLHRSSPVKAVLLDETESKVRGAIIDSSTEREDLIEAQLLLACIPAKIHSKLLRSSTASSLKNRGLQEYLRQLDSLEYYSLSCYRAVSHKRASPYFWINLCTNEGLACGVVEIDLPEGMRENAASVLYLPCYHRQDQIPSDEDCLKGAQQSLAGISKNFASSELLAEEILREEQAQPLCKLGFEENWQGSQSTPITGLFFSDASRVFPWDRSLSASIDQGRKLARQGNALFGAASAERNEN